MSERGRWNAAFVLCAATAALPFLCTYRMPMADLPQHAAQVALWKAFSDPCFAFAATHEVNFLTPYLIGYSVARLFSGAVLVNAALKITAWLAVIALPLTLRVLAGRRRLDPWIALIGFPLAFGFTFYWGFLNFMIAVPFGLLLIAAQDRFALERPEEVTRLASSIAVLGLVLVVSHGVAFAVFGTIAFAVQAASSRSWRDLARGWAPLVIPGVSLLLWVAYVRAHEPRANAPLEWGLEFQRLVDFPTFLLAAAPDSQAAVMAGVVVFVALLTGVRPSTHWRRWVPAGGAAAAYSLIPASLFGQILMSQRFAVPVVALALLALDAHPPPIPRRLARTLVLCVTMTWLVVLAARFHRFDAEARGFDRLAGLLPSNQRVLLLNLSTESESVPGAPFLHFAGYYQERKGGVNGWSFARNFPSLIRYRPGAVVAAVPQDVTYDPRYFRWDRDGRFDAFFVHAPVEMSALLFGQHASEVPLRGRSGMWWLYARDADGRASCPPLEPDGLDRRPVLRW